MTKQVGAICSYSNSQNEDTDLASTFSQFRAGHINTGLFRDDNSRVHIRQESYFDTAEHLAKYLVEQTQPVFKDQQIKSETRKGYSYAVPG